MQQHISEEFEAVIRNVIGRGMFAEIKDIQTDGLISFQNLSESVTLHPSGIKVTGDNSGITWKIGDTVRIKLLSADLLSKQMEFGLV